MIFNDTDYKNYGNTSTSLTTAFPVELIPKPVGQKYFVSGQDTHEKLMRASEVYFRFTRTTGEE